MPKSVLSRHLSIPRIFDPLANDLFSEIGIACLESACKPNVQVKHFFSGILWPQADISQPHQLIADIRQDAGQTPIAADLANRVVKVAIA